METPSENDVASSADLLDPVLGPDEGRQQMCDVRGQAGLASMGGEGSFGDGPGGRSTGNSSHRLAFGGFSADSGMHDLDKVQLSREGQEPTCSSRILNAVFRRMQSKPSKPGAAVVPRPGASVGASVGSGASSQQPMSTRRLGSNALRQSAARSPPSAAQQTPLAAPPMAASPPVVAPPAGGSSVAAKSGMKQTPSQASTACGSKEPSAVVLVPHEPQSPWTEWAAAKPARIKRRHRRPETHGSSSSCSGASAPVKTSNEEDESHLDGEDIQIALLAELDATSARGEHLKSRFISGP
mmetsp:Transcript_130489/g.278808  ORF Transcript_130489/g.278808 Transcript_130489/m.278808 type:complete len:297 (+) Transcript_130489:122-1012(+)